MSNPTLTPPIPQTLLAGLSRTISRGPADDLATAETAAVLLRAFQPGTPIQAMLAAQAVALHHAAIDCFGRAMQTPEEDGATITRLQRNGASLTRAFAATLHTLQRIQVAAPQAVQTEQQHLCTFHAPPPGRAAVVWGCGPAWRERPKNLALQAPCKDQRPAGTAATTVQ